MMNEKIGEMRFNPFNGPSVVARSPEDLAIHQIAVSPDVMISHWGKDAPQRFVQALRERGTMAIIQPHPVEEDR